MKESNEWVRQPKVDTAADKVAAERGCHPAEVKPYWVAKMLGVEHNGALSEKVFDWRRRRMAENATLTVVVPTQAEVEFRERFEQLGRDAVAIFRRTVATIGSEIDHAAALRIADAERRRDQAEVDRDDVLVLCRQAEEQRAKLEAQLADLQMKLEEARRANYRLLGRLEQRELDARAQAVLRRAAPVPARKAQPDMSEPVEALAEGPPDAADEAVDDNGWQSTVSMASSDEPLPQPGRGEDQLPGIETDHRTDGEVEMPLAWSTSVDTADDDGEDRG